MTMETQQHSSSYLIPSNPPFDPDPSKQTRIMESFKAAVLHRLAHSLPNKALSSAHIATIERRLQEGFPFFRIPTHPTYASMIQTAILELKEEGGSMESSISEYIVANYEGLPWAHKTYLSHYLNKLCENGEIMCTSSKCYTIPGSIHQPKCKKKQLRRKPGRMRQEGVTDEGNLVGGELIWMDDNEVCFQEEETQVFMRNRLKRRSSSVVYEEDEEVGEKDAVERECDMIIEEQHELSELNHIDEVGKGGGLRQHGLGTDHNVNGALIMEQGLSKTQKVIDCKGGAEPQAGLIESAVVELIPKEGQDEVGTEVLPLNHDSNEGTTELLLPLVPSSSGSGKCKNEAGADALPRYPNSSGADLMPVGDEDSLKKSAKDRSSCATNLMIVPFEDPSLPVWWEKMRSVSKEKKEIIVCGLPSGVPARPIRKPKNRSKDCQKKPLLLVENILPASPRSLVASKAPQYEQMNEASLQPGHETKLDQTILESSEINKSPLQTGQVLTSSPPETIPVIDVEEAPFKLEKEKQKLNLNPLPSSGLQDLSTDDEDLNLPLHQVVQKCGKQRKLSEGITTLKAPVASLSSEHANLEEEPPGAENMGILQRNNKVTRGKRKKVGQQLKIQLRSQSQKCGKLEAGKAAGPKNEVFSSFQLAERCDNRMERHDHHNPQLADSMLTSSDKCIMEYLLEQQGDGQVQQSFSHVELMPKTVSLDAQCHELGENQQKMRGQHLYTGVENSEVSLREPSVLQNLDGQNDQTQQSQTEMVDVASSHLKPETAAVDNVTAKLSSSVYPGRIAQSEESLCPVNYHDSKRGAGDVRKNALSMDVSSEQQHNQTGLLGLGEPPEQREAGDDTIDASFLLQNQSHQKQEAATEPSPNLIIEAATVAHQLDQNKGEEAKNNDHIAHLDFEPTSNGVVLDKHSGQQQLRNELFPANLGFQGQDDHAEEQQGKDESDAGLKDPQSLVTTPVKRERRGRPRKEREEAPGKSASPHLLSPQQNNPQKKDGRGRPRKRKETEGVVDPLRTLDQVQESSSELGFTEQKRDGRGRPRKQTMAINSEAAAHLNSLSKQKDKQPKRIGRGRPQKQKETASEAVTASLTLHHQQKNEPPEPETHQHSQLQIEQPEGDGWPQKQSRVTEEDAAVAVQLNERLQEEPFKLVVEQNKCPRRGCRGRPRKQNKGTEEEVGAPLNFDQQQKEGLSEPATHQIQNKKQKGDGFGGPLNKDVATKEGLTAASNMDNEELEGPSQLGTQQHSVPDASIVSDQLDQKEVQQKQAYHLRSSPASGLLATSGASLSFDNTSHQLPMEQEQNGQGKSYKPETAAMSLDSETLQQCQEGVRKSTTAPVHTEDQSHQLETEHKAFLENSQLHSPDKQLGKSQYQNSEMPSNPKEVTTLSVNESPEQLAEDGEGHFTISKPEGEPSVNQTCQQQEGEQCRFHQGKQVQARDEEKTPKQKTAKTRAVEVPLSSKAALRSRTKCQSQSGT